MRLERGLQVGLVAIAIGSGYLTRASAAGDGAADVAMTADASARDRDARTPRVELRDRRGWRRPAGAPGATFEPALIDPEELPSDDLPTDEPRDPVWAEPMEREMSRMIDRKLAEIFPTVTSSVQCRTTTCRAELLVPAAFVDKVTAFMALAVPLGRNSPSWDYSDPAAVKFAIDVDLANRPSVDEWRRWATMLEEAMKPEAERLIKAEKDGTPWFPGQ